MNLKIQLKKIHTQTNENPSIQHIFKLIALLTFISTSIYALYMFIQTPNFVFNSNLLSFIFFCIAFLIYQIFFNRAKRLIDLLFTIPLLLIIAGKVEGLLGLLIFFTSNVSLGAFLNRHCLIATHQTSWVYRTMIYYFLGLLTSSLVFFFVIHTPFNYNLVYFILSAVPIFLFRVETYHHFKSELQQIADRKYNPIDLFLFLMALFFVFLHIYPAYYFEDINVYLYIPKQILQNHYFIPTTEFVNSFSNVGTYPLFTILYALGGEDTIRLFLWSCFLFTLILVKTLPNYYENPNEPLVSIGFISSIPILVYSASSLLNDFLDLFLSTGLLTLFLTYSLGKPSFSKKWTYILLFWLSHAVAVSIRLQVLITVIPTLIVYFFSGLRRFNSRSEALCFTRNHFFGGLIFFFYNSLWMIRNYYLCGNPVMPFFSTHFKTPYFFSDFDIQKDTLGPLPQLESFSLIDILYYFWDALFKLSFQLDQHKFFYLWVNRFGFGFGIFVVLLTSCVMFLDSTFRKKLCSKIALISILGFILYYELFIQARYLYTALPFFAILAASIFSQLATVAKLPVQLLTLCLFLSNFVIQTNTVNFEWPGIKTILRDTENDPLIKKWMNQKALFQVANRLFDKTDKVMLAYNQGNYFSNFQPRGFDWYFYPTMIQIKKTEPTCKKTSLDMYELLFNKLEYKGLLLSTDDYCNLVRNGFASIVLALDGHTIIKPNIPLSLDKTYYTNTEKSLKQLYRSGWYAPEKMGTWSHKTAELSLLLSPSKFKTVQLELSLSTLPTIHNQTISIWSNNALIYKGTFRNSTIIHTREFKPDESGITIIQIESGNAFSPKGLGLDQNDTRNLGIFLQSITLNQSL